MTYQQIDFIDDLYIPILALITIGLLIKDALSQGLKKQSKAIGVLLLSVAVAYLLMAIDNTLMIWPAFGFDYSTHTALALVFVVTLSLRSRKYLVFSVVSMLFYATLMVYQQYHTVGDILSTAAVLAPLLIMLQKRH